MKWVCNILENECTIKKIESESLVFVLCDCQNSKGVSKIYFPICHCHVNVLGLHSLFMT